jgi:hypothetical protein
MSFSFPNEGNKGKDAAVRAAEEDSTSGGEGE